MFVRQFLETRRPPSPRRLLASRLPWGAFVDDTQQLMQTRDDGYLVGFDLNAHDLESLPDGDVAYIMYRLNDAFKRLPPSWCLWLETRRRPSPRLIAGRFPDPVSQWLEEERCDGLNARGLWGTSTYLYLWRRPMTEDASWVSRVLSRVQRFLFTSADRALQDHARREFEEGLSTWLGLLHGGCTLTPLAGDEFLSVLYEPLLSPPRRIRTPTRGDGLHTLAEVGIWPAVDPMIGPHPRQREYLGCLSVDRDFPPELMMGMWRDLWRVPVPFRCMWRWIPVDAGFARKKLDRNQDDFETSRLRVQDLFWSVLKRDMETRQDAHIDRQKHKVDQARDLMLSDEFALGDLTTTLVVQHPDLNMVDEMLLTLAKPIHACGCSVKRETYNTTEAFFSTLAGLPYVNVRQCRMTTLNVATIGPFHAPYQGPVANPHLRGPVLTHGVTSTCMLARVSSHDEDCADTLVVGPKGSGKSTLMAWTDLVQWLRYPQARVMAWSNGGSFRCVAKCLGGEHYNLYRDALNIQILRDVDNQYERPWILTWLLNRLRPRIAITADVELYVQAVLDALCRRRELPRTLRTLDLLMGDHNNWLAAYGAAQRKSDISALVPIGRHIRGILRDFAHGGIYGQYVDADADEFNLHRVVSIDPGKLIDVPEAYAALLEVIFHRSRQRRDGAPTRYIFDEAHHMLDTPTFVDFLAIDIPDWRRENSSGCFGTQALAQLQGSRITSLLFESSVVRYYLPNAHAMEGQSLKAYEDMGLHRDEILAHIAQARPKREVYMVRGDGRRRIDMGLFPIARDICGANSIPAHQLMDQVEQAYPPDRFAVGWLRACGHDAVAETIDRSLSERGLDDAQTDLLDALAVAD